jgi:DNA-binding transcriptional LysR family regulator
MLKLNDDAFRALASRDHAATLRFATSAEYVPFFLTDALDAFRAEYPDVVVEVTDGLSCQLAPQVRDGRFDLVLCHEDLAPRNWESTEVWRGPLKWITSEARSVHLEEPLPEPQRRSAAHGRYDGSNLVHVQDRLRFSRLDLVTDAAYGSFLRPFAGTELIRKVRNGSTLPVQKVAKGRQECALLTHER